MKKGRIRWAAVVALAVAGGALSASAGEAPAAPPAAASTQGGALDTQEIERLTGAKGELSAKEGVFKVSVPRTDIQVSVAGVKMSPRLGLTSWAAFAGSNQRAVVDGDFAMLESERQPVLKALRAANIQIVAIHDHMTGEEPRILFLHYWGVGAAAELARGVRSALDQTAISR